MEGNQCRANGQMLRASTYFLFTPLFFQIKITREKKKVMTEEKERKDKVR